MPAALFGRWKALLARGHIAGFEAGQVVIRACQPGLSEAPPTPKRRGRPPSWIDGSIPKCQAAGRWFSDTGGRLDLALVWQSDPASGRCQIVEVARKKHARSGSWFRGRLKGCFAHTESVSEINRRGLRPAAWPSSGWKPDDTRAQALESFKVFQFKGVADKFW
jgi:hypothetical protein